MVYGAAGGDLGALSVEEAAQVRSGCRSVGAQRTSKPSGRRRALVVGLDVLDGGVRGSLLAPAGPSPSTRLGWAFEEGLDPPSGRFFTQPARPSSSAFSRVESRKNTPCTWPDDADVRPSPVVSLHALYLHRGRVH